MAAELPKKYKAVVYDKPGSISTKVEELDMPEPGPGEVLINLYVVQFLSQLFTPQISGPFPPIHCLTNSHKQHSPDHPNLPPL